MTLREVNFRKKKNQEKIVVLTVVIAQVKKELVPTLYENYKVWPAVQVCASLSEFTGALRLFSICVVGVSERNFTYAVKSCGTSTVHSDRTVERVHVIKFQAVAVLLMKGGITFLRSAHFAFGSSA